MEAEIITRDYIRNFFRLSDSEQDNALLDEIMLHLKPKEYSHNSYICRVGDEANEMFFIESGTIIVRGNDGEVSNELHAGKYFGEYAAITGDKRMADIQAHGTVMVYVLDKEALLELAKKNSNIYGIFLRNVYAQSTEKYRKLTRVLNTRRGLGSGGPKKKMSLPSLIYSYSFVVACFLIALFFAPKADAGQLNAFWLCSPILFMVLYVLITKHAHEALLLAALYIMVLLGKIDFIGKFNYQLLYATKNVADVIFIILLMGSLTQLFAASGSINALRDIVKRRIKSAQGTMFAAFLSMVLIALDEYLSIMINNACFKQLLDKKNVPREKSSIVLGLTPSALCVITPFSIVGIYKTGIILLATGQRDLFLHVIPYNFGAYIAIIFILMLIFNKLPLFKGLKQAQTRVDEGGALWPSGTDINEDEEEQARGRILNLILPVFVFIASSSIIGTISAGHVHVDVLYGMIVTLIFTFFLYVFQQYMTAEQFLDHIVVGIEHMIAPVFIFIIGKIFSYGLNNLGFTAWLDSGLHNLMQEQAWLMPSIIFAVCTLIAALFNDFWAVYAICIPIAATLAVSFSGNIALYIGAVCSAGFLGSELVSGNSHFIGQMLGVNHHHYYNSKLPYIFIITGLTFCAYLGAGFLGL